MRTTLTLDDDVAVLLQQVQKQRNATLKEVVNTALRDGLVAMTKPPEPRPKFQTKTFDLGGSLIGSLDNVTEVLSIIEGEDHK